MLNQIVLVGRLVDNPEVTKLENDKIVTTITIAVQRVYKNPEGIYETDLIKCVLWNNIAEKTVEFCKKDDVVGIKGRLQVNKSVTEVVAEKVTFISNKKDE
ncbi:MAG: single-stranded DNA-binding protein [Bacilli bacterium]|nr:single-stranded DNA-binding protein [Bacilli bacterium]